MLNLRKKLFLRLALPILIPLIALGAILYFFVLSTISEFAKNDIQSDLAFHSRRVNNICNINFDNLLLSGLSDDPDELIIKQALTLGQIEDFFVQESLQGYIFDLTKKKITYQTDLPMVARQTIKSPLKLKDPVIIDIGKEQYYTYVNEFSPWNWQILVLKNANVYSYLITKVQRVHLYTLSSLTLVAFLMIFFIFKSINEPTQSIVNSIQLHKRPIYQGIDVFEFLSDTIAGMMTSIQQSEDKYRMLVENSSHMIWELDVNLQFTFVSPTVKQILGYQPDEVIGKEPFLFMNKEDAVFASQMIQNLVKNESAMEELVTTYIHKNGQTVIIETTGRPFFDENNQCLGYRGVNREITERFRAEKSKIEAQKIAADQAQQALVGQIAGKMAHDFNNILSIIMGNSELALIDTTDEESREIFQIIFDQTKRGQNLTKNLVAFAKDQEPKQEFFDVNEIMDLVLNLMRKDLGQIELETGFDYDIPELLADPGMIEHSLVNLIQNSIHALSLKINPKIIVSTFYRDHYIYIEIHDNGCGIPEKHIDDIFAPAFTLKGKKDTIGSYKKQIKGTGYGMSNIKKYIQLHKGYIDIDSVFGKYTKVLIKLPVIERELSTIEKQKISNSIYHTGKNILLVEDEQTISQVQSRILSQEPCCHTVNIAANGDDAIQLFDQNIYDVISLDYILPGSLNGMDIYNHIRKTNTDIPILFISGNIEFIESIKDLKKNDPLIDHLSKPCQNTEYINAVNKLISLVLNNSDRSA